MRGEPASSSSSDDNLPALRFALPVGSESRWSDLLAVLIATDSQPLLTALDLDAEPQSVRVSREVSVSAGDRPDLLLEVDGRILAVIEVKVLAGLGIRQLDRYAAAVPNADRYVLIAPGRLPIHLPAAGKWLALTWESILDAYRHSTNEWVSRTAAAWLKHLELAVPAVDANTQWNALRSGEDFVIALRARISWVYQAMRPAPPIEHDMTASSAGVSSVARMYLPAQKPGYWVMLETEERLPVRDFPKYAAEDQHLVGPSVLVALLQEDVTTSAEFDWDYLLELWPLMAATRNDWVTAAARPRAPHDRAGHQAIIAKGAPPYLGIGFGERQTRQTSQCMFGARFQLPPDITLGNLVTILDSTSDLLIRMSATSPPTEPEHS